MAEPKPEAKTVEQDYHYQVDQQASVNSFMDISIDGENVRLQITNRYGSTPEKIAKTVEAQIEAWKHLRGLYPRPTIALPQGTGTTINVSASSEPTRIPVDDSGKALPEIKTLTAERLSVESKDGRYFFKVIGKPWSKFGVSVWPETLEAAGLNVTPGQEVPNIAGWTAEYICKDDGKPLKVTRLLKK